MRKLALVLLAICSTSVFAQENYEMTTYYMVFLKKAPAAAPIPPAEAQKLQDAHLANIKKMFADGKLAIAGPFTDNGDIRGIFILTVGSLDEAKSLVQQDPMVKAGRLAPEIHPWMAAKGLSFATK
jgi:uncharacterized protein YciI